MDLSRLIDLLKEAVSAIVMVLVIFATSIGIINPRITPFTPQAINDPTEPATTITLIDAGASPYVIVKGANASPSENTAAQKLQAYLKQISGTELPIVPDSTPAKPEEIIIGKTNREGTAYAIDRTALGDDGFVIQTAEHKIIIAGGEQRGTLYGVFDFLEKYADCHWLSAEVTIIPETAKVTVPATINEIEIPAFTCRAATFIYSMTTDNIDYALANKINGLVPSVAAEENGGMLPYYMGHNADAILPPVDNYGMHPEYFSLLETGERDIGNPCLSNADVIQIFLDYAIEQIQENPSLQVVTISLNDSSVYCTCEQCKAIYAEEGGATSGTLIRMLNYISDEIVKIKPDIKIVTLAYASTVVAPRSPVRDNIILYYCPILMCYAHPLEDCDAQFSREAREQLEAWGKVSKNILIFEYPMNYNQMAQPYPIWDALQQNIQYYYANNARGLFICSSATCDPNFFVLDTYLYAKLLWDPAADMDQIMGEFLAHYYGDGWQYIQEYLRVVSEDCNGRSFAGVQTHMTCVGGATKPGLLSMTTHQIEYCNELWKKAKEAATEDGQLDRLRSAEISYRVWKSCNSAGEFTKLQRPSRWIASNRQLFADINELGLLQHDEGSVYVSPEEFEKFKLYYLSPTYWTWRKLGRDKQYTADNLWDVIW